VAQAGLAPVVEVSSVDDDRFGLDSRLSKATLADGTEVVLRINSSQAGDPRVRASFLAQHRVGAPTMYASDGVGACLLAFVPGRPLGERMAGAGVDDQTWKRTGSAYARVHAVRFPSPLQGTLGPTDLVLAPLDPVGQLHTKLDRVRPWVAQHQMHLLPAINRLHSVIERQAAHIRWETPCLTHGDPNLLNIIVGEDAVTLIDWDYPSVRYPLAELSALDEQVYLWGGPGLPPAFFAGYGREVPTDLLIIYRVVGCLSWLSGDDWTDLAGDRSIPETARQRLTRWHEQLLSWIQHIPDLSRSLGSR
jgi:hypothetical protein